MTGQSFNILAECWDGARGGGGHWCLSGVSAVPGQHVGLTIGHLFPSNLLDSFVVIIDDPGSGPICSIITPYKQEAQQNVKQVTVNAYATVCVLL